MAQSFKLFFVLLLVAYLGSGRAAHISLPSDHEETSLLLFPEEIDPCKGDPCGMGATCQPRFGLGFVCLCSAGDFYDSKSCRRGKVFPGKIVMLGSSYDDRYADKTSLLFWGISSMIEKDIKLALSAPPDGFIGSTVLKVEEFKLLFFPLGVIATVEIIYGESADITTKIVKERLDSTKCTSCLNNMIFICGDLCKYENRYPCDTATTDCSSVDGNFTCSCKDGYIPLTDRACIETTSTDPTITPETTPTDPTITPGPSTTTPTITTTEVCPDGQHLVDSECVDCPFGYSGSNCGDPWLLILVIVGSILGGLLLIALILLPIVACASSGRCFRRTKNPKAEVPRIPRASSPRSWDTNSLEMSLRQGRSNPRYVHDNGRRFNY